jgi:DNA (cytosine-5)-methyltransferase 1
VSPPEVLTALEVFSGGGGAAWGLVKAGFRRVICIDNGNHAATLAKLGPAVEFHRMDWRAGLARFGPEAHVITGGPPCQRDSKMMNCRPGRSAAYPDLVEPFRAAVEPYGVPWWIEQPDNPGARAKLGPGAIMLCGTHFALEACNDAGVRFGLQRHRLFASGTPLTGPGRCRHIWPRLPVYGHGAPGNFPWKGTGMERAMREGMGIGWMPREALAESIPWLFAAYVAGQLLAADPRLARWGLGTGWEALAVRAVEPQII